MNNGKHMQAGKDVSAAVNARSGAEIQHPSVAQDVKKGAKPGKKSVAEVMYPVRRGLRGTILPNGKDKDNNSY